jgi:hypothetical protein
MMGMHARSLGLVKLNSRVAAVANGRLAVDAPFGAQDRRLANQIEG